MAAPKRVARSFARCLVVSTVGVVAVLATAVASRAQPDGASAPPPVVAAPGHDALAAKIEELARQLRERDAALRPARPTPREVWPAWAALACVGVAFAAAWWAVTVRRDAVSEKAAQASATRRESELAEGRHARAEFSRHVEQIIAIAQQREPTAEANAQLHILTGLVAQLAPPPAKGTSGASTS